jgi:ferredoxin
MIKVDKNKCIGCGLCVSMCPDVFKMDDEGKSVVISQDNKECAKEAVASCPVKAISI